MNWQTLILGSFLQPRDVARVLLAWNPPMALRWQAVVLLAILSTLMTSATVMLAGPDTVLGGEQSGGPVVAFAIELGIYLMSALLVTGLGQLAGGQGRFADALLLMGWVQFLLLLWQVPQCLALLVAPPLFLPLVSVGIVLLFWWLTQFTTALHGFGSPLKVFAAVIGVFFLFGAALSPFMQPMLTSTG
jgi:Yip1 domain